MANADFFDQFGEKMRSLQPSERTAGEDWQSLSQRMDAVLPTAQPTRRRWAVPLLLLLGLVSNLWWGFTFQRQSAALERVAAEVVALKDVSHKGTKAQSDSGAAAVQQKETLRVDTVWLWRTPAFSLSNGAFSHSAVSTSSANSTVVADLANKHTTPESLAGGQAIQTTELDSLTGNNAFLSSLATLEKLPGGKLLPLKMPVRRFPLPPNDLVMIPLDDEKDDLPWTKKISKALTPKTFRIGATAGWLYPLEADMEHQMGFAYGLQADVGFSRQFSFSAEWGRVALHYKALAQDAAIGLPSLPLPSPEHQFLEMDVSNQRLVFYGLGLRYKGLPQSSWHPFGSFSWSGMKVLPFEAHYETEMAGSIFKGKYSAQQRSELKNFARLGAGVEFPLGRRFDWSLEGFYLHSWRNGEPDMAGVRTGLSFIF